MLKGIASSVAAWLLAGCALAPTQPRPSVPMQETGGACAQTGGAAEATAVDDLQWQAFVNDDALRELIALALANRRDPGIRLDTNATPAQGRRQAGAPLAAFGNDRFARARRRSRALEQDDLASEAAARSARIRLVAEVIQAGLSRDAARQRYFIATEMLEVRQASLALIAGRRRTGRSPPLDYRQAVDLVRQAQAERERIRRELGLIGTTLARLVGVADVDARLPAYPGPDNQLVRDIASGMPSALIARRPDVHAAEHRLRASEASVGAARASLFPRIALTGASAGASVELSGLFAAGQRTWPLAPRLTPATAEGGRDRADLDRAKRRRDIAVAAYGRILRTAFREVRDVLAAADALRREEDAQRAVLRSRAAALRRFEEDGLDGGDDPLRHLDAQHGYFASQMVLVELQARRQITLVMLFRALGGGWPQSAHGPAADGDGDIASD